jgi:V-type H+-transporting ATPase proteolipid subunit
MGVCQMGVFQVGINRPNGVIKNVVSIVMAGVLSVYGLIIVVVITQAISSPDADGCNTAASLIVSHIM